MSETNFMDRMLAVRTQKLSEPFQPKRLAGLPSEDIVKGLRQALLDGETHYTDRPGIAELRQHLTSRLNQQLAASRSKDTMIVTNSEREALFACLLAIRMSADADTGEALPIQMATQDLDDGQSAPAAAGYRQLVELLGFRVDQRDGFPQSLIGRFDAIDIWRVALQTGASDATSIADTYRDETALLIGAIRLDGLAALPVGFASVTPTLSKHVRTWKQALSICTAAPSQRATILALTQGVSS